MLSTRICRLDNLSDCSVVGENAAALLENSSSELAIIVVVAFILMGFNITFTTVPHVK